MEYKGHPGVEELSSLLRGESPRCAVIVAAAFFDERLKSLLADTTDSSFSARIKAVLIAVRNRAIIAARIEPPGWLRDGIVVQLSAGPHLDFTGPSGYLAPGSAFPRASRGISRSSCLQRAMAASKRLSPVTDAYRSNGFPFDPHVKHL